MKEYHAYSEIWSDLESGEVSCTDLVQQYLENIDSQKGLNIFLETFGSEALQRAEEIDRKIKAGKQGKLAGMVIGLKDNLCYKGNHVAASSKILEGFESVYNATVVERLLEEDAIIIGRLNCDEFAMGSSNENSAYGPVKNPVNPEYVPGGSSGGSAAAVKANLCHAALGSDTGGSIRQPASFCDVVGFKPTYGRVSRYGLLAYASSFDQIGPLTRSVEDAALITQVISGSDEFDSTLSRKEVPAMDVQPVRGKKRVAFIEDCIYGEGVDKEVRERTLEIIDLLKAEGHEVVPVSFPYVDMLVPTYYVLTTAEASSNLARYDGVHFGHRSKTSEGVEATYVNSRTEGFGEEVKRRIMLGTFVLSAGHYDAYYTKGLKVRQIIKDWTDKSLSDNDFLLLPTCPSTAFKIGENIDDPITMYLQDIFTVHANLAGNPAISLPLGLHSNGLPFGIQLMNNRFAEPELFSFSHFLMEKCGVVTSED